MDEFDLNTYRTLLEQGIDPSIMLTALTESGIDLSSITRIEIGRGGTIYVHRSTDKGAKLMPFLGHHTNNSERINKPYNPDFDFPEDFELSDKLFEEYWNKKIQKHGSLENALYVMHKIGIDPNNKEKDNTYISKPNNSTSDITLIEDRSDLEHKMRQMITIANSINLPRNCLTDDQHYIGLQQSVNSIIPGDQSSYSSLERSVNELRKNWG